jgi:Na+/H+ antiporter NhaD/arsenite permease-like protein
MSTTDLITIIGLLLVFAVGTFTSTNLGALAFVATFLIGTSVLGEDVDTLLSGFPIDLFMLIFGVTYLFGIAAVNGTLDWLVGRLVRLVRGNASVLPALLFVLVSAAASAGALAPSVVAIFGPVSLRLARQMGISRALVAIMVVQGANAGALTPIGGLGPLVNGIVERNGLDLSSITLFLLNYAFNAVFAAAAYVIFGLAARARRPLPVPAHAGARGTTTTLPDPAPTTEAPADETPTLNTARGFTLAGIAALAVGILVLGLNIGLLSLSIAVLLQLAFPAAAAGALARVSWPVIVLICGVVTYVEMMQRAGTIDAAGNTIAGLSPVLAVFLLSIAAAFISAFASSAGTIAAIVPLALPLVAAGGIGGTAVIAAIAICTIAVDASPFSSTGALAVSSAHPDEERQVFRALLRWSLSLVVVAPVVTTGTLLLI